MVYRIQYQTGVQVGEYKTLEAAVTQLVECQRAARCGGDCQSVRIVHDDGSGLDVLEQQTMVFYLLEHCIRVR